MKKIIIASDHAGNSLKEYVKKLLLRKKLLFKDVGTKNDDRVDYPDFAHKLSKILKNNRKAIGVLICGSGQGMIMTANKQKISELLYAIMPNQQNYQDCIMMQILLH